MKTKPVSLARPLIVLYCCAAFIYLPPSLARAEVYYPWKNTYIGALHQSNWPGMVIALPEGQVFAFRLRVERESETAEAVDFHYLIAEVGPHSPDGQYARVAFDLGLPFKMGGATPVFLKPPPKKQVLTLEWSRRDERTVIGRISAPRGIRLELVHYFPWDVKGEYRLLPDGRQVRGSTGKTGRYHYLFWTNLDAAASSFNTGAEGGLVFDTQKERDVYFAATAGEDPQLVSQRLYRYKNAVAISDILAEESDLYEQKRSTIRGLFQGADAAIANNLHWSLAYQPGHHRLYLPAGRSWTFPRGDTGEESWAVFNWDALLSSLALSLESSRLALDTVRAVLETQYPNGNIPGWRSSRGGSKDRSLPPIGAYVVLKLFQRTGDLEFLRYAYPYLKKWHEFWTARRADGRVRRDGNSDGLLEWGSDPDQVGVDLPAWEKNAPGRLRAAWESGQDDLPSWDEAAYNDKTGTLNLNSVDLNSFYALDAWCLAEIAGMLGFNLDAEVFQGQYESTKLLVNQEMWNEKEGFYLDRFWDGRFSAHKAAANFLPLLAGIPDRERADKMLKHLLDPKKFWGEYVVPCISRDDPSFRPGSQQYWRGTVWPPLNYLIYQGLKAYGYDAVAYELAKKSAEMFLRTWKNFQICPENFDSLTGEAGGQRQQVWGPLLSLTAVEEYLDFTPFEGFRFGMLKPEKSGRLTRVQIQGRQYEVRVSGSETTLKEEDGLVLSADTGAVFRRFLRSETEFSFRARTLERTTVRVWFLKAGKYELLLDGRTVDVFRGASKKFEIPEGEHAVAVRLLEDAGK